MIRLGTGRSEIERHPESWIGPEDARRAPHPYRATVRPRDAAARAEAERRLARILGQAPSEAPERAKIAELALHAPGHVLEFGTRAGGTTALIAAAVAARPAPTLRARLAGSPPQPRVFTVDRSAEAHAQARAALRARGLLDGVRFLSQDSVLATVTLIEIGRTFGFCIVDHSRLYTTLAPLCRMLPDVIARSGFLLFGSCLDAPGDPEPGGVARAIARALDPAAFDFHGTYGRAALYRRR